MCHRSSELSGWATAQIASAAFIASELVLPGPLPVGDRGSERQRPGSGASFTKRVSGPTLQKARDSFLIV